MLNIIGNKKVFFIISGVLMLASIVSLVFQGFNLDTDFAGGMAVTYGINEDFAVTDVEAIVSEALGVNQKASSVQKSENNEVIIKFGFDNTLKTDDERTAFSDEKIEAITKLLTEKYAKTELKGQDIVSPSTGQELARSAVLMSILAALAILIYITIRFEFVSGVCAVIALVHDILILCGIYSVCRIAIDTTFIAAILTVLGYSINATIVIFDRIRENTRHAKKKTYGEIANESINQTIGRSINTTVTTLLTIGMVFILGVTSIKEFALPIIIGILIGTYSSICIAGSVWSTWKDTAVKSKDAKQKA
ncbi:MAG: protein translocase subunit SecF [Clostridia bacterium]|nr:protein translocase subunit SecF [Clostridia bacterium]